MKFVTVRVMSVIQVRVSDLDAMTREESIRTEVRENVQNAIMQAACCGSLDPDDTTGEVVHAMVREAHPVTSSRN